MNVAPELVHWIAGATGCNLEGFPQTYLGLPMSNVKLNLFAFAPLISKTDKYWQVLLLSLGGRIILVNSVMDNLPTYVMATLLLPKGVVEALEKRRHAFLWIGENKCSGAHCHRMG